MNKPASVISDSAPAAPAGIQLSGVFKAYGEEWERQQVIHDFNLVPQYQFPPNPFLAFAYLTGIRKKSHRDWRCLKGWQEWSEHCRDHNS